MSKKKMVKKNDFFKNFATTKLQLQINCVFVVEILGSYSQHFIFFLTYKWANKPECLFLAGYSNLV